jgi:enamine deaminase RidA (YjgF/YER057c/UK114 family)
LTIKRFHMGSRMSQVVVHRGTIYLAGQIADEPQPSVRGQTRQILAKIDRLFAEAASDRSKILSANVWLPDMGRFAEMNQVRDAWVAPGATPARAHGRGEARPARQFRRDHGGRLGELIVTQI